MGSPKRGCSVRDRHIRVDKTEKNQAAGKVETPDWTLARGIGPKG